MKSDRPSHKEQYRREYMEHTHQVIADKMEELVKTLRNIDQMFEAWYAQKFPDEE